MKFYVAIFLMCMFATPTFARAEDITVTVKGMVCSFCAQGIKKTFGKNVGVAEVEVDLEHKRVSLKVRQGATLSDESITTTINDAGYDVLKIERGPHA
ncbi:MAG: heavy-metal-associated domain-containing protein [Deltaproteobacteria bacterium]|nr:heavy-metal-associated domain-containing protein [Deltaproteobacteria bacterium]